MTDDDHDRRTALELGAEHARQHARDDLELECPPGGVPIGEGLRRIRRRNRLIDWLVTVLIVVAPLTLIVLAILTYSVNGRADRAVTSSRAAERAAIRADAAAKASDKALGELKVTNARLTELVDGFAGLVTADTPEARAAARAELGRLAAEADASTTTTTTRPRASGTSSRAPATTTTTARPAEAAPTTTTTSSPPPPSSTTTTTRPPLVCVAGVACSPL